MIMIVTYYQSLETVPEFIKTIQTTKCNPPSSFSYNPNQGLHPTNYNLIVTFIYTVPLDISYWPTFSYRTMTVIYDRTGTETLTLYPSQIVWAVTKLMIVIIFAYTFIICVYQNMS